MAPHGNGTNTKSKSTTSKATKQKQKPNGEFTKRVTAALAGLDDGGDDLDSSPSAPSISTSGTIIPATTNQLLPSSSSSSTVTTITTNQLQLPTTSIALVNNDNETNTTDTLSVWYHVDKIPNNAHKAKCKLCSREYSRKGGNTTGIRKHLFYKHGIQEFMPKTSDPNTKLKSGDKYSPSGKRRLNEIAIKCVVKDGRSFGDLSKPGLCELFDAIAPGFRPPHRNTVQKNLKRLRQSATQKLKQQLRSVDFLGVTSDFWSDARNVSYLVLTGHYVDKKFRLKNTIISFSSFSERHFGYNIAQAIENQLRQLVVYEKTRTITCDGASNVKKSFEQLDPSIQRLQCLGHKFHLIVCNVKSRNDSIRAMSMEDLDVEEEGGSDNEIDDSEIQTAENENDTWAVDVIVDAENEDSNDSILNEKKELGEIIQKVRNLVKIIKRSSIVTSYVNNLKLQYNVKRSLQLDCITRWNSTLLMVEIMLLHKPVMHQLFADKHLIDIKTEQQTRMTLNELSSDDWNVLESIQMVLKPFYEGTKLLSGSHYATVGMAFFAIHNIKEFLQEPTRDDHTLHKLKQMLLEQLDKYFEHDRQQYELIKVRLNMVFMECA
ncbi:unnamed protein product [Didymodactylos carnosus]|uniref:BED-type domain-containing protein n=1 Tax=Didymodactylos carnosus TaxID=1234261 RepID=A0A8S2F3C5_9BILA|nr:unnamed protein product [Didymodactylos carnosus]CAF4192471.1 unnamed protein product [Didymodactylos carnosus]